MQVTANIQDTNVDGIEGLNLKLVAPFKFQDYTVGFRYALGNLKTAPESLFARKSFDLGDSKLTVNADYTVNNNIFNVAARWTSDQLGLTFNADADTRNRVKTVSLKKDLPLNGNNLSVRGVYDLIKKKAQGGATFDADGTTIDVDFDSESQDPELSVVRKIDSANSVNPTIKLRSGQVTYGYKRSWDGGSLVGRLFPGNKVSVEWKDNGAAGAWVTKAEVPLADTKATKVSLAREWVY
jgi:hypothetical protein